MAVAMELIRTRKSRLSMDLAPLIDVVFQLLVFFMLTSSFANPAMKLVLPQASAAGQMEQENIVITIDRDGQVFLNDRKMVLESLRLELQKLLAAREDQSVHVKGDQQMPYKFFIQVMDLAKQAGATQVNIVYQQSAPQ